MIGKLTSKSPSIRDMSSREGKTRRAGKMRVASTGKGRVSALPHVAGCITQASATGP